MTELKLLKWNLETRKLSSLKDNPRNPRKISKHDAENLQTSLEKFGLADKLICNIDGTIIGGHQRKKILKKMKLKEVEVLIPERELTEKECDELCLRLNRNRGEFDNEILVSEWNVDEVFDAGFLTEDLNLESIVPNMIEKEEEPKQKCTLCGQKINKKSKKDRLVDG